MEQSFVIIKPDAVRRLLIGKILSEYEQHDLKIKELEMMIAPKEVVEKHYEGKKDKPFFNELVAYLTSGKLVAATIEGKKSIHRVRAINGDTNPEKADPHTIRGKYGLSLTENTVHASDSLESAEKEINLWLTS